MLEYQTRTNRPIHDVVLVVDFGSQYTQLIARRLRELGVYSEVHPHDHPPDLVHRLKPKGVILSGGPETVRWEQTPRVHPSILRSDLPILGICYGMQTLVTQLGGSVEYTHKSEFGRTEVSVTNGNPLFEGVPETVSVWMSHGDHVTALPPHMEMSASSENCGIAACMSRDGRLYGLQFHPEVTHTDYGLDILRRFVLQICRCTPTWSSKNVINDKIDAIQSKVGDERVVIGLSGGVDSSVTTVLLSRALGSQVECIFVDTGLLREQEVQSVMTTIKSTNAFDVSVKVVQAKERFYEALRGIAEPETKRKVIGGLFIDVFEEEAEKLGDVKWLAQGTIYPDVVESAQTEYGKSHVIKSHHNVGGLPERLQLKILEPLRDLFKDEVRKIGLELGLPTEVIARHPFPGPGLAIRIAGTFNGDFVDTLRQADYIFLEELKKYEWYDRVSQAFAVLLPTRSVGVVGDTRVYDPVCALRAVTTTDFMTAEWAKLPFDLLGKISNRIVNEVKGISRVVYDVTSKPPATIEWE